MTDDIKVIVITGGPNAGKTTILARLRAEFEALDYTVEIVPEAATQLIEEGYGPAVVGINRFQRFVLERCILQEEEAKAKLRDVEGKKVIFADRGVMDGVAYVEPGIMETLWEEFGYHLIEMRDLRYAGVIHLVTTAIGLPPHLFSNATNPSRYEKSAEEAAAKDNRTRDAWVGCPHLGYVDNSTGFEEKIERALEWARYFLGEQEHERKFKLLVPFERSMLPDHAQPIDIRQSYVRLPNTPKAHRIRARGQNGKDIHLKTMKSNGSGMSCAEDEKLISEAQYWQHLSAFNVPEFAEIVKTRWCFVANGFYWELDIFRDWKDELLEVELPSPSWQASLPSFLEGKVTEVTGLPQYMNKYISREIALERRAA
jgi:CYTH domain-containing protein/predicted ATPase